MTFGASVRFLIWFNNIPNIRVCLHCVSLMFNGKPEHNVNEQEVIYGTITNNTI